ncbi:MAG: SRPBCC family protein [Deltaproteobacteria bacterium]|nr:SRPBCC family protein [Deltaproteobacteria bacterium]
MAQASESIEINASPKECYDVITDYGRYPEFLTESKNVVVEKKSGHTAEVTFTLDLIKKFSYTLKMVGKPPHTVAWSFVRGALMKRNDGEWTLEKSGNGTTRATYSIDIDLGLFVPGAISRMLIGSNLPGMLKSFKKRIEERKK